jgi:GNAT superfamily N-acetyltransferase/ribosomal protein S18 acetylase RimI-like enzyme
MDADQSFDVDERLDSGLRYTEQMMCSDDGVPRRRCRLWLDGVEDDVSEARLLSFNIRFGQVDLPAEGYAGVQTRPEHRRKGYIRQVMTASLGRARQRVDVAFLFGIEGLYGKFGFASCLASGHIEVPVRGMDQMDSPPGMKLRPLKAADVPQIVELYNRRHARRPWTWRREPGSWNRLDKGDGWRAGAESVVLEVGKQLGGYMVYRGVNYGGARHVEVLELTGADAAACQALLIDAARRCWDQRLSSFQLHEPPDSLAGMVARRVGCEVKSTFKADGGGMGAILNRPSLIERVRPELERRAAAHGVGSSDEAFELLGSGQLCADEGMLLRLLMGFWSWADAGAAGYSPPPEHEGVFRSWFCGGGTTILPQPFAHRLDHY